MKSPRRTRASLAKFVKKAIRDDPQESKFSLAKEWGYEPAYFFKLLSGRAPAGPTVVARATLSISPKQARELIENYLLDIADQIDFERRRLGRYSRERGGQFVVKISVAQPRI